MVYHCYSRIVLMVILINICGSNEITHKSPRDTSEKRETSALNNATLDIMKLNAEMKQLRAEMNILKHQQGGATYTRWGKTFCSGYCTETVYKGQVGGGKFTHTGASVNYICLPNNPNHAYHLGGGEVFDYLYGAEYQLYSSNKPYRMRSGLLDHDVPCAVCRVRKRSSSLMIPGRNKCYSSWTKEYDGFLMAGQFNHPKASEYACVDKYAETVHGGYVNHNGVLFYPVKVQCGALKCPPYTEGTDVPCVVCTK